jgi:hypothetical protein
VEWEKGDVYLADLPARDGEVLSFWWDRMSDKANIDGFARDFKVAGGRMTGLRMMNWAPQRDEGLVGWVVMLWFLTTAWETASWLPSDQPTSNLTYTAVILPSPDSLVADYADS